MKQRFRELAALEVLGLAVSLEEEDARINQEFARRARPSFSKQAAALEGLRVEEDAHRRRLIELFQKKFGNEIPLIRRQDVRGLLQRDPLLSFRPLEAREIRERVALMELET